MRIQPLATRFKIIGAADISYCRHTGCLIAVILSFKWPSLDLIESVHHVCKAAFPYVPGLLAFGRSHPLSRHTGKSDKNPMSCSVTGRESRIPEELGFAAHLGLCLGIPTVGCAKSRLCGDHERLTLQKRPKRSAPPRRRAGRARLLLQRRREADLYLSRATSRTLLLQKGSYRAAFDVIGYPNRSGSPTSMQTVSGLL